MGEEITRSSFSAEEFQRFRQHLNEETQQLEQWFQDNALSPDAGVCGLELEGWLLDRDWQAAAENEAFLQGLNDPLVVPELSRFNFEINTTPQPRHARMFKRIHRQLRDIWGRCKQQADTLGLVPLQIGILPTLKDDVMTVENMSPLQRYHALNEQVLVHRHGTPLNIDISGDHDRLQVVHHDVMTEAATTSLQIHIQLDNERAVRFYNAAHVLAAPMVASCANSPYLFGQELWEESRIPLFEQSVSVPAFHDREGHLIERATFGTRYVQDSLMEIFRENRDFFPVLLPALHPDGAHRLAHLRLHNGTIWRWNRPLVDFDGQGRPTLRLEHRVTPAGPSLPDVIANILFFYGLIHYLADLADAPEHRLAFEHNVANFYQAARHGMAATVFWLDGHEHELRELLLGELVPAAAHTLGELGIDREDIDTYLHAIVAARLRSGQTGSAWQKRFVARHGRDFQNLTRAYYCQQQRQVPVHQWTI
ncbi:glutamate-cysteine ligase family protein [Aquisalimonas sp.]|uniref:glutamate-cysteine ligase family protein n=1 Tax=Aquisalimonas sp. TaxID=1872621 RepID=UPI0025B810A2|nr:glutamate-cysteine ligase family protein [Aquisalimonas sp.]